MMKCKRCFYYSRKEGNSHLQWCPDLDCYVIVCRRCGTPEQMARKLLTRGAVFD